MEKDNITLSGAVRLSSAILEQARLDYIQALRWLKCHQAEYKVVLKKVLAYEKYISFERETKLDKQLLSRYRAIMKKPNDEWNRKEYEFMEKNLQNVSAWKDTIKKFRHTKKPQKPDKKENKFYIKGTKMTYQAKECESFYKSSWYRVLTLNQGIDGKEIIDTLRKQVLYEK